MAQRWWLCDDMARTGCNLRTIDVAECADRQDPGILGSPDAIGAPNPHRLHSSTRKLEQASSNVTSASPKRHIRARSQKSASTGALAKRGATLPREQQPKQQRAGERFRYEIIECRTAVVRDDVDRLGVLATEVHRE